MSTVNQPVGIVATNDFYKHKKKGEAQRQYELVLDL